MNNKWFYLIFIILIFSCKTKDTQNISISYNETADGWLNRPTTDEFYYSKPLDTQILFVLKDKFNEAIILLENIFYKKLTNEEYTYFTGNLMEGDHNVYLIRSVNYSFNENGYRIYKSNENNLLISHGVLSSGKWKGIQKWPIIIYEDLEKINKIYTSYSVVK
jgi:hypothetical protein